MKEQVKEQVKAQLKHQDVMSQTSTYQTSMPNTLTFRPSIICSAIAVAMPSAISTAIRRSLMCSVLAASALSIPVLAAQQDQKTSQKISQQVVVTSGELGQVLNKFAAQHNTVIYFDAKLVKGLQAKAINGRYTIEQALTLLLSNSKLTFVKDKNGNYQITKGTAVGTLATAVVASEDLKDGSSEDGYLVEEISAVGPWQGTNITRNALFY